MKLTLAGLADRHPGITPAVAETLHEAARVCLDRHHSPVIEFAVHGSPPRNASVAWQPADQRCRAAHYNDTDATEMGACCLALAATEAVRDLVTLTRAPKLSGADYYLGRPGTDFEDLEAAVRLEVSGIDSGTEADVKRRLRVKLEQARNGQSNLPAMAVVVAFLPKTIMMADLE